MTRIFISYARADGSEIADELADRLRALDHEVFLDTHSLTGGTHWQPELSRRIKWAQLVVVLVTEASNNSDHVYQEVDQAARQGKVILPVQVDDAPLPVHLRGTWQAVKFQDDNYENVLLEIERTIRQLPRIRFAGPWQLGIAVIALIVVAALAIWIAASRSGKADESSKTPEPSAVAGVVDETLNGPTQTQIVPTNMPTHTPRPTSTPGPTFTSTSAATTTPSPTDTPFPTPAPPQWQVMSKDNFDGPDLGDNWSVYDQRAPTIVDGKLVLEGTDKDWDVGASTPRNIGPDQGVLVLFRFKAGLLLMQIDQVDVFTEESYTWQFGGNDTGVWEVGKRWGPQGNSYEAYTRSWFAENAWYYVLFRLGTDNQFSMAGWPVDDLSTYTIEFSATPGDTAERTILRNFGFAAYGGTLEIESVEWLSFPPDFEMPDTPPLISLE